MKAYQLIRYLQRYSPNHEVFLGVVIEGQQIKAMSFFEPRECLAIHHGSQTHLIPPGSVQRYPENLTEEIAWTELAIEIRVRDSQLNGKGQRGPGGQGHEPADPGMIIGGTGYDPND